MFLNYILKNKIKLMIRIFFNCFTKNYYIFFYASTCSSGELDEIMNKSKF